MLQTPGLAKLSERIADYDDARNALMGFLQILGLPCTEAVTFTPHSFRHWMPTIARQLELSKDDVADLGRWEGAMPPGYDSVAGARELKLNNSILTKWQRGWRPVSAGMVPRTLPDAASNLRTVAHLLRGSVHWYRAGIRTLCRKWECGTPGKAVDNASFILPPRRP